MFNDRKNERPTENKLAQEEKLTPGALSYDDYLTLRGTSPLPLNQGELPRIFLNYVDNKQYSQLEAAILIHLDHLDGIKSSIKIDPEKKEYPTGVAFIRDATTAEPLKNRLTPDNATIEANNMLLRVLGTMRGIDHVLKHKTKADEKIALYTNTRANLQKTLRSLVKKVISFQQKPTSDKELKALQKKFNTSLYKILRTAKLDTDLETSEDVAKLLAHYRDLSSTLDPAKSMVTILKDQRKTRENKEIEIIHTETAHPITKKTELQKNQLEVMKHIGSTDKNFHASMKKAFQEANAAFYDRIKADDSRLPAQARNTIAPTLKNGYAIHNKLESRIVGAPQETTTTSEFRALRCGSMTYVGPGEAKDNLAQYTRENLLQLAVAAKKFTGNDKINIHITMLLTDTSLQHQDTIIKFTKNESQKLGFDWSYVPTNLQGLMHKLDISSLIINTAKKEDLPTNSIDLIAGKESRIAKAAMITKTASEAKDTISLATCASGQDRSGTDLELTTELWAAEEYSKHHIDISRLEIEQLRALGCHNAVLASLAATGSPGMKHDSQPGKFFSPDVTEFFYRVSAETNKSSPLDKKTIEQLLNPVDKAALEKFSDDCLKQLKQVSDSKEEKNIKDIDIDILVAFAEWGRKAIEYYKQPESHGLFGKQGKNANDPKSLEIKNEVANILISLTDLIENLQNMEETIGFLNQRIGSLKDRNHISSIVPDKKNPSKVDIILSQLEQLAIEGSKKYHPLKHHSPRATP